MKQERDVYVDIAKGLAMLLVVRIHTEVFGSIHAPYPIIAVPLFFFLSGFYDNTNRPIRFWLPKAFKSLFLTGVIWVLLSFAYISLLHYLKDGIIPISFSIYSPLIGGGVTWFLFALFYAKCSMWLIHKLKLPVWANFLIVMTTGALASRINIPFLLDEGLTALPFYYLGRISYPYTKSDWKGEPWAALAGFICLLFMPCGWFPWVLVPCSSTPITLYPLFFLMTALSFITVLWLCKRLTRQKWLAKYGTQTLGILVLHPLMLHTSAVILNRIFIPGSVVWIITFLCVYVIVCVACYYCSLWITKHCPFLLGKY